MPGLDPVENDSDAWATGANQALDALNDGFIPDQTLNNGTGAFTTNATFASGTTFTVPGDATAFYVAGRRLKIVHAGGTTYCEVAASAFTTVTTVTIGTITSGPATMTSPITSVAVGLLNPGTTGNRPDHADLGGLTANDHHAQAHAIGGGDHTGTLAHSALSSVTADQHHAQLHASAHQPGGGDAMAVDAAAGTGSLRTLGAGAQQAAAGNHTHIRITEAKATAGASASESVTWTTAFGSTPIVTTAGSANATELGEYVSARSTTGATINTSAATVKMCIAQEAS